MEEVKFLLFVPKEDTSMSRDLLPLSIGVVHFFLLWLFTEIFNVPLLTTMLTWSLIFSIIIYMFFNFYSLSEKEKLHGDFTGYLIFKENKIVANQDVISIDHLDKMEFFIHDYDGKSWNYYRSIEPKISIGVGNRVKLYLSDNSMKEYQFQLRQDSEFERKMRDLLISYHLKGKVSFLALIQYIGISDNYEEIQKFKIELTERTNKT